MFIQVINGQVRAIAHEKDLPLLQAVMNVTSVERAGHVVPASLTLRLVWNQVRQVFKGDTAIEDWCRDWATDWVVDLSRSGGPQLGPFKDRAVAIQAEEKWVFENLV